MTLSLQSSIAIICMNDPTTWVMFHGKLPIYQGVKTVKPQEVPENFFQIEGIQLQRNLILLRSWRGYKVIPVCHRKDQVLPIYSVSKTSRYDGGNLRDPLMGDCHGGALQYFHVFS